MQGEYLMMDNEWKTFVMEMAAAWPSHDAESKRIIEDIVHQYPISNSGEFMTGMFWGMMLPLERIRDVREVLDAGQEALWFSMLKYLAHRASEVENESRVCVDF
jgi:hypothetical protein